MNRPGIMPRWRQSARLRRLMRVGRLMRAVRQVRRDNAPAVPLRRGPKATVDHAAVKRAYMAGGVTQREVAKRFGITASRVHQILHGRVRYET